MSLRRQHRQRRQVGRLRCSPHAEYVARTERSTTTMHMMHLAGAHHVHQLSWQSDQTPGLALYEVPRVAKPLTRSQSVHWSSNMNSCWSGSESFKCARHSGDQLGMVLSQVQEALERKKQDAFQQGVQKVHFFCLQLASRHLHLWVLKFGVACLPCLTESWALA